MIKAIDQKAEIIIKLFPKIIYTLGKIHQDRLLTEIADPNGNYSNLKVKDRSGVPLTFNQYLTLIVIQASGNCSVNELAGELKIAQSSASQLVDRLVKAGYVTRVPHNKDRRKMIVSLAKKGADMMGKRTNTLKMRFTKILSLLEKNEQLMLKEAFIKLYIVSVKLDNKLKDAYKSYEKKISL